MHMLLCTTMHTHAHAKSPQLGLPCHIHPAAAGSTQTHIPGTPGAVDENMQPHAKPQATADSMNTGA